MTRPSAGSTHCANRVLAALDSADFAHLEPQLETVALTQGAIVYEAGMPMPYVYFPHNSIVSLRMVLAGGRTVEIALLGREALFGGTAAAWSWSAVPCRASPPKP
jgi:hypothetical protein